MERIDLGQSELVITADTPEELVMEAHYVPNPGAPPMHLHPKQDEHFEIVEGEMRTVIGGEDRVYRAGEDFDVPAGTPHQMWNDSDADARFVWRTTPGGRTAEWFRTISRGPSGEEMGRLLEDYSDTFRLV